MAEHGTPAPASDTNQLNDQTLAPPTTFAGTLKQPGPSLIFAGAIVGSGELIATTAVGCARSTPRRSQR